MAKTKSGRRSAPWERSAPKEVQRKPTKKLSPGQKKHAKARARRAGRHYPNLVDNMHEASAAGGARKSASPRKSAAKKKTTTRSATTRSPAKKSSTRSPAKKKSTRTSAAKKKSTRTSAAKKKSTRTSAAKKKSTKSAAKKRVPIKDPKGGLTAAGRRAFRERDGSQLKPGVTKKESEMSPTEMKRKGSWAARFYGRSTLPPLVDDHGEPTRFALTAAAWGEPVPRTEAAARKIADKGRRLLEKASRAPN